MLKVLIILLFLVLVLSVVAVSTPGWSQNKQGLWKKQEDTKHNVIVKSMSTMSILVQIVLIGCLVSKKDIKPAVIITLILGVIGALTITVAVYKPMNGAKRGYSYWIQVSALGLMVIVGGLLTHDTLKGLKLV